MKRGRKPKPELSPEIAALKRLSKDGASSNAAVRRRIALIAAERKLDPSETRALMKGRCLTLRHLGQFAEKHRVNLDWLIGGNLKGLLDTARGRPSRPQEPILDPWYEVGLLLRKLGDQNLLPAAVECMRLVLERQGKP
jgi:hypothetical protein